jgi:trk system potassium uptake protein TrkA
MAPTVHSGNTWREDLKAKIDASIKNQETLYRVESKANIEAILIYSLGTLAMSIVRRALILGSGDEASIYIADILSNNGYIVHVLAREEDAKRYLEKPVYIHIFKQGEIGEELEKIANEIEVALLLSFDERLNISLGKILRSKGVPMAITLVRSSETEESAEKDGLIPINISRTIVEELMNMLKLRFTRFIPVDGSLGVLALSIASDSKLVGKSLLEIEDKYMVKILIIREGRDIRDPSAVVQEGDRIIVIGRYEDLRELALK